MVILMIVVEAVVEAAAAIMVVMEVVVMIVIVVAVVDVLVKVLEFTTLVSILMDVVDMSLWIGDADLLVVALVDAADGRPPSPGGRWHGDDLPKILTVAIPRQGSAVERIQRRLAADELGSRGRSPRRSSWRDSISLQVHRLSPVSSLAGTVRYQGRPSVSVVFLEENGVSSLSLSLPTIVDHFRSTTPRRGHVVIPGPAVLSAYRGMCSNIESITFIETAAEPAAILVLAAILLARVLGALKAIFLSVEPLGIPATAAAAAAAGNATVRRSIRIAGSRHLWLLCRRSVWNVELERVKRGKSLLVP